MADEQIADFLRDHFPNFSKQKTSKKEQDLISKIVGDVRSRFSGRTKFVINLALDFTIVAQRLSLTDEEARTIQEQLTVEKLFDRYEQTAKKTLTLKYGDRKEGIRSVENKVVNFFRDTMNRTSFPHAPGHNTGSWGDYQDLLVDCFKLSETGKYDLCVRLLKFGLEEYAENDFFGRETPRIRLFELIVSTFSRSAKGENGGTAFQGMAYGFFKADRPHVSIIAAKVRTGSSRQKRIGDIDCYLGLDLELSVEVKDLEIKRANLSKELGAFQNQIDGSGILGIALVDKISPKVCDGLLKKGVVAITTADILATVRTWDWPKQNAAVNGMLHFLSHIEQNPKATTRLLAFIREKDPSHDSLTYSKIE